MDCKIPKYNLHITYVVLPDYVFFHFKSLFLFPLYSPQNENLNLMVRIKFLNLFLYSSK